ncbi:thiamine pyrophosphate-binding protein [Dactylosporangium salmoneum]|uniref:Thiamine pyrophosphate enzyme N-terminal TPP-binding domain-containing protein n=1 Tax=Dactylosporangium salmoneum TaxID=53361 RepID=A0ABN3HAS7_9ACTN
MGGITAEVLISRLAEWGVDTVFGLPGNGIMEGLRRNSDTVRFVLVHHDRPVVPAQARAKRGSGPAMRCGGVHGHRLRQDHRPHKASIATTLFQDKIQQLKG